MSHPYTARRSEHKESARLVRQCVTIAFLLALIIGSLAVWAASETASRTPATAEDATDAVSFAPHARVMLFSSSTGQWDLTAFAQARPGNEFTFDNRLYRAVRSGKAQAVPDVNTGKLVEADLPCDKASRRPVAGDVVQVLGTDLRSVGHAVLGTVDPGATIRFQGKAYRVGTDRSLVGTGTVFAAAASTLQRIEITRGALRHIIDRHTADGTMTGGKSVFTAGEDIQALIRNAQLSAPAQQADGNSKRIFDAGRAIGIDRATGKLTSTYTVITTQSGKLVTAFPGMP